MNLLNTPDFYRPINEIQEDTLSEFMNQFVFVPNGFGHQHNDIKAVCKDRMIGDFDFVYLIGGRLRVIIGQRQYDCVPGDLFVITPFVKHSILAYSEDLHDDYWLHIDISPDHLQSAFFDTLFTNGENCIHIGLDQQLISLYRWLESEHVQRLPGAMQLYRTIITQIITLFIRNRSEEQPFTSRQAPKSEQRIVAACTNFIKTNTHMDISVKQLAEVTGVSESYIFRAFQNVMRIPPHNYAVSVRIKYAERMLKTTDINVCEISDSLGFQSPYYFSAVFKKHYGKPPSIYRDDFIRNNMV